MDTNIQPVPLNYNQTSISLPLDENSFKDFMVSLLGQPESIEGMVEGPFEIDIGGFEHLNSLIDSRIDTQNLSSLLEFRAKLFFNDGSSISFNGVQSLLEYKEMRPLICNGFIFTWSYLVKFNNKQASEKQEISVSSLFKKENSTSKSSSRRKSILSSLAIDLAKISSSNQPKIDYSIRCTDKNWGIEISEIIRNCLCQFIKTGSSPFIKIRRAIVDNLSLIQTPCLMLGLFVMWILLERGLGSKLHLCKELSGKVKDYKTLDIAIEKKIDFLVQLVASCNERSSISFWSFMLPVVGFFVCATVLPILICKLVELPNYRFIIFTQQSKKERDAYFQRLSNRRNFWVVTVIAGCLVGVLGNWIFTTLTGIFR
jgi:hypothetical protein